MIRKKENNKCNKLLKSLLMEQIVEILAKNAVNAVEQVASETGFKGDEKLEQARAKVRAELTKYNISMTDKDLDTFVESAVKQMNDAWKGR